MVSHCRHPRPDAGREVIARSLTVPERIDHKKYHTHTLRWIDTRMMVADGLTKGAVARDDLHRIMNGILQYAYEFKDYSPPRTAASDQSSEPPTFVLASDSHDAVEGRLLDAP